MDKEKAQEVINKMVNNILKENPSIIDEAAEEAASIMIYGASVKNIDATKKNEWVYTPLEIQNMKRSKSNIDT